MCLLFIFQFVSIVKKSKAEYTLLIFDMNSMLLYVIRSNFAIIIYFKL
jgi:hypothetical protein